MKKFITLFTLSILISYIGRTQTEIGLDYRYNTGGSYSQHAIGGSFENFSGKNSWTLGINYNLSSFGAEKGSGLGVFAGYRYGFSYGGSGNLFTGLDLNLIFNKDAKDKSFTLLSPALEFGYHHTFNQFGKGLFGSPAIGVGYNFDLGQSDHDDDAFFRARTTVGYRF